MQYRLFGHCIPVLWCQKLDRYEDSSAYNVSVQCCFMRSTHAHWICVCAPDAPADQNTPAEIFDGSLLYLNIYTAGLIFLFFYNITTGIFSAMGDSRTPFLFLAFSSVTNIFVDMLFVIAFHMGIAGVAWATFLCQSVSCMLSVYYLMKRLKTIHTEENPRWFSLPIFKKLVVIAVPSILQQSFVSFGNIIIQGLINSFGASITAGYAAAVKLNNLVITSFTTLGNGMSNFTAQNYGAGKIDRIRQGCRAGIKMIWILCVPVVLLYLLAGREAVHLFMDKSTGLAMDTGVQFLRIVVPCYFVVSVKLVSDGVLRGTGMHEAIHDRYICRSDSARGICSYSGIRNGSSGDLVCMACGLEHWNFAVCLFL